MEKMIRIKVREDRFVRGRKYGIRFVCLVGSVVFLIAFTGIYMSSEAKEVGSGKREVVVTFKGTYEEKKEEDKGDERKQDEKRETTGESQSVVKEGASVSVPKSLPQTGEEDEDMGPGLAAGGLLLAGCLCRKRS